MSEETVCYGCHATAEFNCWDFEQSQLEGEMTAPIEISCSQVYGRCLQEELEEAPGIPGNVSHQTALDGMERDVCHLATLILPFEPTPALVRAIQRRSQFEKGEKKSGEPKNPKGEHPLAEGCTNVPFFFSTPRFMLQVGRRKDSKMDQTSPWMTAEEAAAYLKVSRRTLLDWVRRGQIHGYQLSGTKRHVWRFQQIDLDAALGVVNVVHSSHPAVLLQ